MVDVKADEPNDESTVCLTRYWADESQKYVLKQKNEKRLKPNSLTDLFILKFMCVCVCVCVRESTRTRVEMAGSANHIKFGI